MKALSSRGSSSFSSLDKSTLNLSNPFSQCSQPTNLWSDRWAQVPVSQSPNTTWYTLTEKLPSESFSTVWKVSSSWAYSEITSSETPSEDSSSSAAPPKDSLTTAPHKDTPTIPFTPLATSNLLIALCCNWLQSCNVLCVDRKIKQLCHHFHVCTYTQIEKENN